MATPAGKHGVARKATDDATPGRAPAALAEKGKWIRPSGVSTAKWVSFMNVNDMEQIKLRKTAKWLRQVYGKFWYIGPKPHDKHVFKLVSISVKLEPKQAANTKLMKQVAEELRLITGKLPEQTYAKMNDAKKGVRIGMPVGMKVNLKSKLMMDFLERLNTIVLPRVREFEGLYPNSMNKDGDFGLRIPNQEPFRELDDMIDDRELVHPFNIIIRTTTMTQPDGIALMKNYGFPFGDPRPPRPPREKTPDDLAREASNKKRGKRR